MKKVNSSKNLLIEINDTQYHYLKLVCEHRKVKINELVSEFIDYGLETHQDFMLMELANERVAAMSQSAEAIAAQELWKVS